LFEKSCNIIVGENGSGKTNILEGISLFDKGRGFRKDKLHNLININNSGEGFKISTTYKNQRNNYNINVFSSDKNSKKISINNSVQNESIRYFESILSIIYFLPEMERLFLSTPSSRRNFLDRLIFTSIKKYNSIINSYKNAINERQLLLKSSSYDYSWIEKLEQDIVKFGSIIYLYRVEHIKTINKILKQLEIIKHFSHNFFIKINDNFLNKHPKIFIDQDMYLFELKNSRKIDFLSGGCNIGPHRSDLSGFSLNNDFNINQFSTGQQKTAILLIIIAQCKYLIDNLKLNPIVLLDEVCSHLDIFNRELILYLIHELNVQIFMTGTEEKLFSFLSTKAHYCNIT